MRGFKDIAQGREQREAELRRVTSRMRKSGWHCFEAIAREYELDREARIYRRLLAAVRAGKFDAFGALFLNPDPRGRRDQRLTRAIVEDRLELFGKEIGENSPESSQIVIHFLRHCWMPDHLFRQFAEQIKQPNGDHSVRSSDSATMTPRVLVGAKINDETAAIEVLASHLENNRQLRRADAFNWCLAQGFTISGRGFQNRIWPKAREEAGLTAKAPSGRKRKSS